MLLEKIIGDLIETNTLYNRLYHKTTDMKKTIIFIIATLMLVACERNPVVPDESPTHRVPGRPLVDGTVIKNAATDYDGNIYNAVVIGKQVWMQSNLRTTHYADGTEIPLESEVTDSIACYYYDGDGQDIANYGYFYNWKAVMRDSPATGANPSGVQGICPAGWHVPSSAEWAQLRDYLYSKPQYHICDQPHVAKALASDTGWNSYNPDMDIANPHHILCCVGNSHYPNNATGFSAYPAGFYGAFYYGCYTACIGGSAHFWSTTEYQDVSVEQVSGCQLSYASPLVNGAGNSKGFGYSVRCLRD